MNLLSKILLGILFFLSHIGWSQYTQVPDAVFEQYLIDEGIDSEGILDGQFFTADALGVESLQINNLPIADLTGLEAFVDLIQFTAQNNAFSTINLSNNTQLTHLFITDCLLTNIDLSQNVNLLQLALTNNAISSINLSNNASLLNLWLENNQLSSIDLSSNGNLNSLHLEGNQLSSIELSSLGTLTSLYLDDNQIANIDLAFLPDLLIFSARENELTIMDFTNNESLLQVDLSYNNLTSVIFGNAADLAVFSAYGNQLTDIDLSNKPSLGYLVLGQNEFDSIDVSQCPLLEILVLEENPLTAPLELSNSSNLKQLIVRNTFLPEINVTANPSLFYIDFENTQVIDVDLSSNIHLEEVRCSNTSTLETVDVRNGNNTNLTFIAHDSPNFTCIFVDDVSSGEGNFNIDPHIHLVESEEECEALGVMEESLNSWVMYPNPAQNILTLQNPDHLAIESIVLYDTLGKIVIEGEGTGTTLDVSGIPSGVYFLRLETEQGVVMKRVVKR